MEYVSLERIDDILSAKKTHHDHEHETEPRTEHDDDDEMTGDN